ncbi:MAG: xanthine dehydrogenase family protein molybdopterin-binding subunit [Candidatus Velthaea sp.]
MNGSVGAPLDRVDGRLKVTGAAKYSAEWPMPNMLYGYLVLSTIANGRIASIDASAALKHPGVVAVMTPRNAPRINRGEGPTEVKMMLLQDDAVHYDRQPVAVVLADTFERAQYAASLVKVTYAAAPPLTKSKETYKPSSTNGRKLDAQRGDASAALAQAPVRVDNVYTTPHESHNPMEPHATTAAWNGGVLTIYESSQGIFGVRRRMASAFNVPQSNVHVITKFVGGGFGTKGQSWPHTYLTVMAAKMTGRPVKIALWRPQMWGSTGYRSPTVQRVALGASRDGKLSSTIHEVTSQTSMIDQFVEPAGSTAMMLYDSPALLVSHRLTRLNYGTPTYMRAPGHASGSFALESAMDELAYAVGLDPIELRRRNHADIDPEQHLPYSSKSLRECYRLGAETFGWNRRTPQPRSMRDGRMLVGLGMASATYPAHRNPSGAVARISADGSAVVQSGAVDIGTGAYTAFTQLAAEELGIAVEHVRFDLGDSNYPLAAQAGGSAQTASVGSAIKLAALDARAKVAALAASDAASPLHGASPEAVAAKDGRLFLKDQPARGETYAAILARHNVDAIEGHGDAKPGEETKQYAMHAFGAQFAEVRVDPDLGTVRLVKQIGAFASGTILNAKLARSQYIGGMTFGTGMALMEHTRTDERTGRVMNANLAEYLVPVHADIPAIDALIVPETDEHVNEIGVKGIGEIGIVGAAAAIANAVYHATGKRVRDLPITPERLLS